MDGTGPVLGAEPARDDKLSKIFGKKQVSMFEMTKLVSKHLSAAK